MGPMGFHAACYYRGTIYRAAPATCGLGCDRTMLLCLLRLKSLASPLGCESLFLQGKAIMFFKQKVIVYSCNFNTFGSRCY